MINKEYINIEKDIIPYEFEIDFGEETFQMEIRYNDLEDFFTLDLIKDGEVLVYGEKIVYGSPLFDDIYDDRFPGPTIIPIDPSGIQNKVGFEQLNETVFLVVDNNE